ncbi:hypothetical protein [Shimia sp. SDUM112013]|uniref:hypothetical protein n=1 Tax=Shimia sp. SDUM112013 TaxID=3136160 RepID=UPI0032EBE24A
MGNPEERFTEAAKISGNVLAGFQVRGSPAPDLPSVLVWVPASWAGHDVCLQAVSQDGRYEARWPYQVETTWTGGFAEVPLVTDYASFLSGARFTDFASALHKGGCASDRGEVAVVSWNTSAPNVSTPAYLWINSFGADEVFLVLNDRDEVDCIPSTGSQAIAYDFQCALDGGQIGKDATVEIVRLKSGRLQPSDKIRLVSHWKD